MKQFRHQIHYKSHDLKKIAAIVDTHGAYFDNGQKRKPTSWKRIGDYVVIEGDILNS